MARAEASPFSIDVLWQNVINLHGSEWWSLGKIAQDDFQAMSVEQIRKFVHDHLTVDAILGLEQGPIELADTNVADAGTAHTRGVFLTTSAFVPLAWVLVHDHVTFWWKC